MLIYFVGVILFIGMGVIFLQGKGGGLLTYFNESTSASKKIENIAFEKKACKAAAVVSFILAIALSKYIIGGKADLTWLINSSTVLLALTVLVMLLSLLKKRTI